jgi:glycosyltransferase involved in cell wall biosynthesis
MLPEVSVVMPVYNGQKYLKEAIESILNQSFRNFEFIIIDDGSTDESREIIKSFKDERILLIEQKNMGVAIALNNAIKKSRTNLIARMDSDDIAMSDRLELQRFFLKSNSDYVLVGSNAIIIDKDGEPVYKSKLPINWEEIKSRFPVSSFFHSSVMYRRSTFDQAGGYLEEISRYNCFEDSFLWHKMKDLGKMANIEKPLIRYRIVPDAVTTKSGKGAILINNIYNELVVNNRLSDDNHKLLSEIKKSTDKNEKLFNYHILLAKKYLWNNSSAGNARKNLFSAMKVKPLRLITYMLLVLSLFPEKLIQKLYRSTN